MPITMTDAKVRLRRPLAVGSLRYRSAGHAELPHIVSFSGGRSSAALAFMAAEEGLLRPERGDLVLFANTSAEHPGTYEFAARCKERLEVHFGLPCLWIESCTVEDAWRGEYRRKASYRLVKPVPVEQDADGVSLLWGAVRGVGVPAGDVAQPPFAHLHRQTQALPLP